MAFAPTIPVPSILPPAFAGAALLADRVEGLLTRFCDSHPDEEPELLIRAARAVWNLTAVRKTIYLFTNPGADRRHRRGKPDATMTYIEHRVSELHDWVAEYQRLVRAMKQGTQFVVTPSGGSPSETYNVQHIENVPSLPNNVSPESKSVPQPETHNPQLLHASDSFPDDINSEFVVTTSDGSSNNSSSLSSPSASSASLRFNPPDSLPLPTHMNSTPPLRNPLGTALATARESVAIAIEANIPFDPTNFFPAEIDPAAAIADAQAQQLNSSSLVSSCLGGETITYRNRQVTLTGKPLPPNDLPQLPQLSNLHQSKQSENPCPLPVPLPNPKVPSRSDFFALINKITKQRPPSSAPPPPSPFDTPGILSESILHNLKPGLRLPNPQPPPGHRRPPT